MENIHLGTVPSSEVGTKIILMKAITESLLSSGTTIHILVPSFGLRQYTNLKMVNLLNHLQLGEIIAYVGGFQVTFNNGSRISIVLGGDSARGTRCSKLFLALPRDNYSQDIAEMYYNYTRDIQAEETGYYYYDSEDLQ